MKNDVFELLCKNSWEEVKDIVYREGKQKAVAPIRVLTEEQYKQYKEEKENEKHE